MHEWQVREEERHNKSKQREFWKNALRDGINVHTVCCVDRNRRKHTHTLATQAGESKKTGKSVGVDVMMPAPDEVPPKTIAQARKRPNWAGYERALEEEISQLEKNNTWTYIERDTLPPQTNILRSKVVFDIKRGAGGEFLKYKARMVAVGTSQIEGVDYHDTYASVMVGKSFRILLAIYNTNKNYTMQHWDVRQAFVNAPIHEDIYVQQVRGCEKKDREKCVLKLNKALYGTRQAAYAWQTYLADILTTLGGRRNLKDECVYIFREGDAFCIIGTHVDDLFPLCNSQGEKIRERILACLKDRMEIDNKGEIKYALDTHI